MNDELNNDMVNVEFVQNLKLITSSPVTTKNHDPYCKNLLSRRQVKDVPNAF